MWQNHWPIPLSIKRCIFLFYSVIQTRQLLRLLHSPSFMQCARMHSFWIPITRAWFLQISFRSRSRGLSWVLPQVFVSCNNKCVFVAIQILVCVCAWKAKRERWLFERWSTFLSLSSCRTHFPSFWFFFTLGS